MGHSLNNFGVRFNSNDGAIYLYRFGKVSRHPLQKRPIDNEAYTAVIESMMADSPRGSEMDVLINGSRYRIAVKPISIHEPPLKDENKTYQIVNLTPQDGE